MKHITYSILLLFFLQKSVAQKHQFFIGSSVIPIKTVGKSSIIEQNLTTSDFGIIKDKANVDACIVRKGNVIKDSTRVNTFRPSFTIGYGFRHDFSAKWHLRIGYSGSFYKIKEVRVNNKIFQDIQKQDTVQINDISSNVKNYFYPDLDSFSYNANVFSIDFPIEIRYKIDEWSFGLGIEKNFTYLFNRYGFISRTVNEGKDFAARIGYNKDNHFNKKGWSGVANASFIHKNMGFEMGIKQQFIDIFRIEGNENTIRARPFQLYTRIIVAI